MTKRDRLNDSSMLQRRISAKTMKIDVNQGSARRGLPLVQADQPPVWVKRIGNQAIF